MEHVKTLADIMDSVPSVRLANEVTNGNVHLSTADVYNTHDFTKKFQQFRQGKEAGDDYLEGNICYMFMTKPNLNLSINGLPAKTYQSSSATMGTADYNSMENGFFEYITRNFPEINKSLTYGKTSDVPNFIPLLFNYFKGMGMDDISLDSNNYNETFSGWNQSLPTNAVKSMAGGSFNISYTELSTPKITFLHKIWVDYIHKVKTGEMSPTLTTVMNKEIDYTSSLYYFLLAPDGETITFWAKYVGVYPTNVPYSSFGGEVGSNRESIISCSYNYSYKEFLQPESLQEFNDIFVGNSDILQVGDNLTIWQTMLDAMITDKNLSSNPFGFPSESDKLDGYKYTHKGIYSKAGIIKVKNKYKLLFFDK